MVGSVIELLLVLKFKPQKPDNIDEIIIINLQLSFPPNVPNIRCNRKTKLLSDAVKWLEINLIYSISVVVSVVGHNYSPPLGGTIVSLSPSCQSLTPRPPSDLGTVCPSPPTLLSGFVIHIKTPFHTIVHAWRKLILK